MKSFSNWARLLSFSMLALLACKPKGAATVKAVVGDDAQGRSHAFSLLTVRNIPKTDLTKISPASNGARYAKEQLDTQFFAVVDCISAGGQSGEEILADMELDAALGNIYTDKDRYMWRLDLKTGKIDQRLPCAIVGSRMVTVNVLNDILDRPYKSASPTATDIRNAQQAYLALRGNTIKAGNAIEYKQLSAPMSSYISANRQHYDLGASTISANLKLVEKFDADFNPCSTAKGKFDAKAAFTCVPAGSSGNAFNYKPKDDVIKVRDELVANLEAQHIATFKYNDAKARPFDVLFEVLTSTFAWGSKSGNAGKMGSFLAGKLAIDFNAYFNSDIYGVSPGATLLGGGGTGAGLALTDDAAPSFGLADKPAASAPVPKGGVNVNLPLSPLPFPGPSRAQPASNLGPLPLPGARPLTAQATVNNGQTRINPATGAPIPTPSAPAPRPTPMTAQQIGQLGQQRAQALEDQIRASSNQNSGVLRSQQSSSDSGFINKDTKAGDVNISDATRKGTNADVDAAFSASVNRAMLDNQEATVKSVTGKIADGSMTAQTKPTDPAGVQRFVGRDGETAFVSKTVDPVTKKESVAVQDWKPDSTPPAGAPAGTKAFTNSAFGDPDPAGQNQIRTATDVANGQAASVAKSNDHIAGLGQTVSVDAQGNTQRAAQVNFAEDGRGAYNLRIKEGPNGMAQVDCNDADTQKQLAQAGRSYREAQTNLRTEATRLDEQIRDPKNAGQTLNDAVARREQVQKELQQNDKLADSVRAMTAGTRCAGTFNGGSSLHLLEEEAGGGGEGGEGCAAGDPPKDPESPDGSTTTNPDGASTTVAGEGAGGETTTPGGGVEGQSETTQAQPESQTTAPDVTQPSNEGLGQQETQPQETQPQETQPEETTTTEVPSQSGDGGGGGGGGEGE